MTDTTAPTGESCDDEPPKPASARTISVTYQWDETASRYVKDSDAFENWQRENAKRF